MMDILAHFTRSGVSTEPGEGQTLWVGKHVADDTDTTRGKETIGYIVIEEGYSTVGGLTLEASSGDFSWSRADYVVRAIDNTPPFNISTSATGVVGVACLGTIRRNDGAWAYIYGTAPFSSGVDLSADETQIVDNERGRIGDTASVLISTSVGYVELTAVP